MLGSKLGLLIFLLLPNDKVWARLSAEEKQIVLRNNARHNTKRPDYANPILYQGGASFDSPSRVQPGIVETKLAAFLAEHNPRSILEIGPGSGYLTRVLVSHPSVGFYTGIDINSAFLDYLRPRLDGLEKAGRTLEFSLIHGDINSLSLGDSQFDAIVFLSAIHHIPDRTALFKKLEQLLNPGGVIFTAEPAHYFPRAMHLFGKFMKDYRNNRYWEDLENYATHHFCTLEEFRRVTKGIKRLKIESCLFYQINFPKPMRKAASRLLTMSGRQPQADGTYATSKSGSPLRYFADRIIVEFKLTS